MKEEKKEPIVIKVTSESGVEMNATVLDIIEIPDFKKEYIFYTFGEKLEGDKEKVYASILIEMDNSFTLKGIADPEEWKVVEEFLHQLYD